jgi:ATP-dependent DNA helicase DinG
VSTVDVPLPSWAHTVRPAQLEAVNQIISRFESGTQVCILDAPTGSGKTLVAELVRRALTARALYLCVDRGLQDQVLRDFDYAKIIKGRRNYATLSRPNAFPEITAEDCKADSRKRCEWCDVHGPCQECRLDGTTRCDTCDERQVCPYGVAKRAALTAQLACANTAYFLAEANGPGTFSDWPLIIADEADRLESVLMGAVTATVSHRRLETLRLSPITGDEDPTTAATWITRQVLPAIDEEMDRLARRNPHGEDLRLTRQQRAWARLFDKLELAAKHLAEGTWVTTMERAGRGEDNEGRSVVFKPVRVNTFGPDLLWRHADRWLLMSATVLNPAGLVRDLGIDPEHWAVVRMGSTFPPARRPIYSLAVAPVTAKHMEAALPKVAGALMKILADHSKDRILVHTVSFKLMDALRRSPLGVNARCLWYTGADGRAEMLRAYLDQPGAVLLAPALERGLDLPDDACRVVVVAKVPYPDLGDKVVAARLHNTPDGQGWYRDQTLRSLVQMTGRGMRHAEDHCVTYLLDAQFDVVLARHRSQLPPWWVEALQG